MDVRPRIQALLEAPPLPEEPVARARQVCDSLAAAGFQAATAFEVLDSRSQAWLCAASGAFASSLDVARGLAEKAAATGRPATVLNRPRDFMRLRRAFAALPCTSSERGTFVVVISDPSLTQYEVQSIACWLAPVEESGLQPLDTPTARLVSEIAQEFSADVVTLALFGEVGLYMQMFNRSGVTLRKWRTNVDTIWGEAARHGAAYVLGDLHLHAGAEQLASIGMQTAAIVGLDNGRGIPLGSLGVASFKQLDVDIAERLLVRAPVIAPQAMQVHRDAPAVAPLQLAPPPEPPMLHPPRPTPEETFEIELSTFAARIGCSRFALYTRVADGAQLVAAHAQDGSTLVAPTDPVEPELVQRAFVNGAAAIAPTSAAVPLTADMVVYVRDEKLDPIEQLRWALRSMSAEAGEDERFAA